MKHKFNHKNKSHIRNMKELHNSVFMLQIKTYDTSRNIKVEFFKTLKLAENRILELASSLKFVGTYYEIHKLYDHDRIYFLEPYHIYKGRKVYLNSSKSVSITRCNFITGNKLNIITHEEIKYENIK